MLNTPPPRGPRGSSPNVRGPGRGGVQKRRVGGNGPVRVDRDGDLVMDAAAADKRRSGKGRMESQSSKPLNSSRTNSGPSRGGSGRVQQALLRGIGLHQANVHESRITTANTSLQIDGLSSSKAAINPDGGLEALLGFLERKASGMDAKSNRTVKIKKSLMKGDSVIITASPEDIENIQKINGFTFAGAVLSIKPADPPSPKKKDEVSSDAKVIKEKLTAVLNGRYNDELKLLNLSALGADPILQQMGLFDGSVTAEKIFPAIMAVSAGIFKDRNNRKHFVISVSLADNGIGDVKEISALTETFPGLQNIDLSRNNIADIKSLQFWRNRFRKLENLILTGNPIEAHLPTLKDEFLKLFPHLCTLNNVVIRTPEEMMALKAKIAAARSPIPIVAPEFLDAGGVGENFIRQFLHLYDNDRSTLLSTYYDTQSIHSISINMAAPKSADVPVHAWAEYIKHSRNLTKIDRLPARMSRQYKGVEKIQQMWSSLPITKHPSLETDLQKYILECRPMPGLPDPTGQSPAGVDGLIITIHGEFEEPTNSTAENKVLRSFSRTFILGPGAPGSPPIRVISDMCILRAWGPLAQPEYPAQPEIIANPSAPQQAITATPEQQQQQEAAAKLTAATGMTLEYSVLCLEQTGWDLARAFDAFTENKDKLPPNAFIANIEL